MTEPRWTTIAAMLALLPSSVLGAEMTGRVLDDSDSPLARATVYVYEARPRVGTSPFCPSCYPDCRKRVITDDTGAFAIRGLNDALLYRVLAVADGFAPQFREWVDPGADVVRFALEKLTVEALNGPGMLHGRVVDPRDRPVLGASLEPVGFQDGERRVFGRLPGVDPLTVTDEDGEFVLRVGPGVASYVRVDARGLAPHVFDGLVPGGEPVTLRLEPGVSLKGTLVSRVGGSSVDISGATVGVVPTDRRAESFVGPFEVVTNERGEFSIPNVPAGRGYDLYVKMATLPARTTVPSRRIEVPALPEAVEVGRLVAARGFRIAGRVVLADGGSIPQGNRVAITRDAAWDTVLVELEDDGRFEFNRIPPEAISIHLRLPGYRIAPRTPFFNGKANALTLEMKQDVEDLSIVLERM